MHAHTTQKETTPKTTLLQKEQNTFAIFALEPGERRTLTFFLLFPPPASFDFGTSWGVCEYLVWVLFVAHVVKERQV